MSQINLKSITGITSITTPAGVDNVFTVHSNDTTERFRVDSNGNQVIAGILTVSQDIDVDGHTNLDNVSIAGVTTTGGITANGSITATRLTISSATPRIYLTDTNNNDDFQVRNENGTFEVRNDTDSYTPFSIASNNTVTVYNDLDINGDLDVDGHTNLDNVSIAGVTTFASNVDIDGNTTFGANGSITSSADFALSSNSLRVTGGNTVVGEFKGTSIPTVQVTQTTNNTDLQLRANSEGGLVRTATNYPLILGAFQREKVRIDGGSYARIGINTSTFDTAGSQLKIEGRGTGTTSPPYLQIKGVGNGNLHSYVDLIATSDSNAGSAYRGLGVVMHDEPTNVEWFSGRPYAGSDKFIIGRKASPSYRTQSSEVANSFFQITSSGEMGVNTTAPVEKLGISGNMRFVNPNGTTSRITALPSGTYSTGTSGGAAVCFQRIADGGGGSDEIFFETHWQGNRHGESCRIDKYGNLKFPSGQGIDFSSQTNEGSTSQNALLADYEEGVWTPTNTIGMTLTVNNGSHYIKIGKQVTVWFDITLTGNPDSAQCAIIQSLPYVSKSSNTYYGQSNSVWYSNTGDAKRDYDDDNTLLFVNNNSTDLKIWNITSGHLRVRSWANNRRFRGTVTYIAKN